MKQTILSIVFVLIVLSLVVPFVAHAYDFEVDGIYYSINGNNVSVTSSPSGNKYCGDVIIPESVTFNGKTYLVKTIGENAFFGCSELTSINIPNSVSTIEKEAFYQCWLLTSINIPNSVTTIADNPFGTCRGLTNITVANDNQYYDSRGNCNAIIETTSNVLIAGCKNTNIPNSVSSISDLAFFGCTGLTNVTIPNSVTTIGKYAFFYCTGLTHIDIPNSVISIGESAFTYCTGLPSVTIPNSVTSIGSSAFEECTGLTNVTIGNSVTSIGSRAFFNCTSFSELNYNAFSCKDFSSYDKPFANTIITIINIGDGVKRIPAYFASGLTQLTSITIPSSITSIGNSAFSDCSSLTELNFNATSCADFNATNHPFDGTFIATIQVGNSAQKIPANFAKGLTTLRAVTIGNSVTTIGNSAFYGCNRMTDLSFGTAVVSIEGSAFYGCNGLTAVTLPSSLRTISSKAFYNCSGITTLTIPKSVAIIKSSAFYGCSGLKSVYCFALTPPVMESSDCFNTYNTSTLFVPNQSLETYTNTYYWNQFYRIYGVDADGHVLANGISLNLSSKTLNVNETFNLIATVTPDAATTKDVDWSSSNTSVVKVNENGLVTALSPGSAAITATTTDGSNLSASCHVTVNQQATSISLNETDATIYTGNTLQLTATVLPSTTSNPSVIWSSSNASVAAVSSAGLVTAMSPGNAVITAWTSDGSNLSATCNVTVKQLATSISLNNTSATLYLDQTVQLTATVLPNNATDKSVTWSSSDNSIATVSSTGLVTAIAPGSATVTVTTADGSNLSATCAITVKAYVTSLTFEQSEVTILEGDTIILTPTIVPAYATDQSLYWYTNNSAVASVNNGVVVGRSGGETTITARTADGSNLSATCKVTVVPNFDISMPDLSHLRGSVNNKFDLTVDLANRYDITGMQFDIQFPDGVTIAKDNNGEYDLILDNTRKSRNHTATASLIGNNTYRILVSSATANSFKGHSGTVLHIMVEIPLYHVSGNKQVKYTNIILSEPDETRHTLPTRTSLISYYYKEGDANADVSVDVADYVITGNYILQNSPENFWYDAANVDHNSTIDVNDLTGITNIALGRREGGILQMPAMQTSEDAEDIELTANPLAIEAGQTKSLSLCLEGICDYAGFQMDLQLPRGIRFVDASLVDENSGLSIATAELPDGSMRLLASSFSLKNLSVNNTAFLKLTLMAADSFNGNDVITLDNIKFSERNMLLHAIDHIAIPVGNDLSGLEQIYSEIRIYAEGHNIIIDSPESGTARIVTIAGITQTSDILPGHNVIPMNNSGFYIVTLNGTTVKLRLK